jgi:hypothetical protein
MYVAHIESDKPGTRGRIFASVRDVSDCIICKAGKNDKRRTRAVTKTRDPLSDDWIFGIDPASRVIVEEDLPPPLRNLQDLRTGSDHAPSQRASE